LRPASSWPTTQLAHHRRQYALDKSSFFAIFGELGALVVGEGETAYVDILRVVAGASCRWAPGHPAKPEARRGPATARLSLRAAGELPTPDFSRLPWDHYLSPEPFFYYSPSRAELLLNKRTFCNSGAR